MNVFTKTADWIKNLARGSKQSEIKRQEAAARTTANSQEEVAKTRFIDGQREQRAAAMRDVQEKAAKNGG